MGASNGTAVAAAAVIITTASIGVAVTFATLYYGKVREEQDRTAIDNASSTNHISTIATWSSRRQEERAGRIRAEIKLRTVLKNLQELKSIAVSDVSQPSEKASTKRTMLLQCIGTVVSPYTKRMGTPRQPSLVPASRGFIQLSTNVPPETLCGIEHYSHIWIIFEFHANTDTVHATKTKIRPPRAGGAKVGQLATRSPHRPNPLGLSLVKLERWDVPTRRLHITGLDLVNGTPVYDVKPVVPWDFPGYPGIELPSLLHVPEWVTQADEITRVTLDETARAQLYDCMETGSLAPLYTIDNEGFAGASSTLLQIISQDPRSSHKGLKANVRGSVSRRSVKEETSTTNVAYSIVFCSTKVSFTVTESGATITKVAHVDLEDKQHVDGVPLLNESL